MKLFLEFFFQSLDVTFAAAGMMVAAACAQVTFSVIVLLFN